MKKRVLSILLALCMTTCLLGALSTTVSAEAPTNVYVGGVDVIDGGYWVSDGAGGIKGNGASESNYTVKYASGTLTLNNAYITKCHGWGIERSAAIYTNGDLNIELLGDNLVGGGQHSEYSFGVYQTGGTLTISGSGSLTAGAGMSESGYSCGIWADSLVIGGGTIIARGNQSKSNSFGIHTFYTLSITGGTVTATGNQTTASSGYVSSFGLRSNDSIQISGGNVTATGGYSHDSSIGVYANTVTISGGTVTAKSGTAAKESAIGTAPNLTGYTGYEWRISEGDGFSTVTYTWSADHTYVQFRSGFVPVTGITMTNAASVAMNTDLALAGTVAPANATNKTIEWSVQDAGGTGAAIGSGVFRATSVGTATLKATITNGLTATEDYIQPFAITVTATPASPASPVSTGGSTSDSTSSNVPLYSSTDPSTGIRAEGSLSGGISVYLLTRTATGRANELVNSQTYNQLLKAVGNGYTPVCAYEVSAQGYSGPLTLTFPVGAKHNGKAFLVKHKTSSGTMESFTGIVADGKVVITASSLSPFMIAVKEGVQIPETGISHDGRMPMEFIMGIFFQLFSYRS